MKSFAEQCPHLVEEWHFEKNANLKSPSGRDLSTPDIVPAYSEEKVWWKKIYVDPVTNKQFIFEWQSAVGKRTRGAGCPYLSSHAVWPGFNDLATIRPELAAQWHPTKNGHLKPQDVLPRSNQYVWWIYQHVDNNGQEFVFEWQEKIDFRNRDPGCPFLSGHQTWAGFNDLATIDPEVAAEWNYSKNIGFKDKRGRDISTPDKVTATSAHKVWWVVEHHDNRTGKTFIFEWQDTVNHRHNGRGCPYISGHQVYPGFNDLLTLKPHIAKMWHPTKNGTKTPQEFTPQSGQKVWWAYSHFDERTKQTFFFEWYEAIYVVSKIGTCPFVINEKIWPGFNDLATINPKLASQWDYEKNRGLVDALGNDISTPDKVSPNSHHKVWWKMPYDDPKSGKHFIFEWNSVIRTRHIKNDVCPFIAGQAVWPGFNDLKTLNPGIAEEWDYEKNKGMKDNQGNDISTPDKVTPNSMYKVWWKITATNYNSNTTTEYSWLAAIKDRNRGHGCPQLKESKGERAIREILVTQNVRFKSEYSFKDRKSDIGRALRDDFVVFDINQNVVGAIEFNGIQHYEPVDFAGKGEVWARERYEWMRNHDMIKTQYLRAHNIPQLIIKYDEFDNIEHLVLDFLNKLNINNELCKGDIK